MTDQLDRDDIENYRRSFNSMWEEIYRTREQRNAAIENGDTVRELILSLEHDLGTGTKVSKRTHDALTKLKTNIGR